MGALNQHPHYDKAAWGPHTTDDLKNRNCADEILSQTLKAETLKELGTLLNDKQNKLEGRESDISGLEKKREIDEGLNDQEGFICEWDSRRQVRFRSKSEGRTFEPWGGRERDPKESKKTSRPEM